MLKNIALFLSIILFFGTAINGFADDEIPAGKKIKDELKGAYIQNSKTLYKPKMEQINFLINGFTQDELSESIDKIVINFNSIGVMETDLMFLKNFPKLRRLDIEGGKKTNVNLEQVKYLNNLEELRLVQIIVSNLSPISNLPSLKKLTLYGLMEIKDLSPIVNLNSLESLSLLDMVNIKDISPISKLKKLDNLYITNMSEITKWDSIENFNPIFEIPNLRSLELPIDRKGKDIKNIGNLKKLDSLKIRITNQAELNIISDLPQLRELIIWDGNFNDVTPLLKLPKLKFVDFHTDFYIDIKPLAAGKTLERIRLGYGKEKWSEFLDNDYKVFKDTKIKVERL
jgi:hypothetical protein